MKRITIRLDPHLELLLRIEASRSHRSAAEVIREAVCEYLKPRSGKIPPGAGVFRSGRRTTANRAEKILSESHFGED